MKKIVLTLLLFELLISTGTAMSNNKEAGDTNNIAKTMTTSDHPTTYTISYNAGNVYDAIGSRDADQKMYDVPFTLPDTPVFFHNDYIQTGWTTSPFSNAEKEYELGDVYTTNASKTFYAYWTRLYPQTRFVEASTWDWSELSGTYQLTKLKDVDIVLANMPQYGYALSFPPTFNAQNLIINGEYPCRTEGNTVFCEARYIKLKPANSGILTVNYVCPYNICILVYNETTGDEIRYLAPGIYDETDNSWTKSCYVDVFGGYDIILCDYDNYFGFQGWYGGGDFSYFRFKKITFTPSYITLTPDGYATFYAPFKAQLPPGVNAYSAEYDNAGNLELTILSGNSDIVPANTPVILIASTPTEYIEISMADEDIAAGSIAMGHNNHLLGGPIARNSMTNLYVLGRKNNTTAFYNFNGEIIPSNKAYLSIPNGSSSAPIRFIVESNNNTTDLSINNNTMKVTKVIKDGQILISINGVLHDALGRKLH